MAKVAIPYNDKSQFFRSLSDTPIDRSQSLRVQVYQILRKAIVSGQLKPKEAINEIAIAEQLGISRTPVREAVKKLSDEGLIDILVQHGTFISEIKEAQIREAYVIRIALELENVALAASKITQQQIYDLEDIIHSQKTALERERFNMAIEMDDKFHGYIAHINNFTRLWSIVELSKAQMDRCRIGSIINPSAGSRTIDEHTSILDALKVGDPEQAREAMRVHLTNSKATTLNYLNELQRGSYDE